MTDSQKPRRRATYDDVLNAPEHMVAEILDGQLYLSPRPGPRHARAAAKLDRRLAPFDQESDGGPGGWEILNEPELHFDEDVLVPDIAGWRLERMPDLPDTAFFTLPPDWVCEVLSPSTARIDREKKLRIYARARIPYAWLLDPIAKTLEVLRLTGSDWTIQAIHRDEAAVRAVPFDAIEIRLAPLWTATPAASKP